jgi:hypothetical protein
MTILEKMDAVLFCLNEHSGENPNHAKIENWLKDKPIDKGEIGDCLLHLHRIKYIYCEIGGNRDSPYYDIPDAHYLISFEGKVFIDYRGGFVKARKIRESAEKVRDDRDRLLVRGTWRVAGGAIALVVWEMLKYFVREGHFSPCD